MPNQIAPQGALYVCTLCGKLSKDLYGDQAIHRGWDVSCVVNSRLVKADSIKLDDGGRVVKAETFAFEAPLSIPGAHSQKYLF